MDTLGGKGLIFFIAFAGKISNVGHFSVVIIIIIRKVYVKEIMNKK